MPRYIDADKLIDLATHEGAYGYVDVHDILNIPTADVVERKKGKWMTKSTFMPDHYGGYYIDQYVCTNCESEFFKPSKFCPNCGADMRENGNETN